MTARPDVALVTGGAGYVGSHVARALQRAGFRVVVYDDLSTGRRDLVRFGDLVVGDVRDASALAPVFRDTRPAVVAHCAGITEVGRSWDDPGLFADVNVEGTRILLEVVRGHDRPPVLFSSTGAVYAGAGGHPIPEDAATHPANPYGESKLAAERLLVRAHEEHGVPCGIFRFFNAAGAAWEDGLGEDHDPESHLIPRILRSLLGSGEALTVFGDDFGTPDGTAIRDYVGVRDIGGAHVAAAHHLRASRGRFTLNLGTGRGHSVLEVIRAAEAATGLPVPYRVTGRRRGDPACLVAECAAAVRELAWTATGSNLERLIDEAWHWHRRRHPGDGKPGPAA